MKQHSGIPESIRDLVTVDLVAVLPHDKAGRARDILLTLGVHAVPVMEGNDVLGIVTSADLVEEWPDDEPVSAVMTPAPTSLSVEASVAEAAELMLSHRIHHLLVTDDIEVMGIISSLDLLQALVADPER
ncbi:MAG: CBS domain-containing protein [Acidimicrobiales bacterium]